MCMLHQQYDLWNPKPWPWHSEAVTADAQPVEVILKMQLFPSCGEAKSKKCDTERKVMLLFFFSLGFPEWDEVFQHLPTSSNSLLTQIESMVTSFAAGFTIAPGAAWRKQRLTQAHNQICSAGKCARCTNWWHFECTQVSPISTMRQGIEEHHRTSMCTLRQVSTFPASRLRLWHSTWNTIHTPNPCQLWHLPVSRIRSWKFQWSDNLIA